MADPANTYIIRFHLYNASERIEIGGTHIGDLPTGHANVSLVVRSPSGAVESPHYGVNVWSGNALSWTNPFHPKKDDGFKGVDDIAPPDQSPPWQSSGTATADMVVSEAVFRQVQAELESYGSKTNVNYNLFGINGESCYSFADYIYNKAGGQESTFVDLFPDSELAKVPNLIKWIHGDLDLSRLRDRLGEWAQGAGDWLADLDDALAEFFASEEVRGTFREVSDWFAQALRAQLIRFRDPIIFDLDGDGIELLARTDGSRYFDMDADGIEEWTGWIASDDGFLALDENNNGKIDSITELIGDQNRSGFAELITHDSNGDNSFDAADTNWSRMRVWRDLDGDTETDAGELFTLAQLGIVSVDLRFTTVNFTAEGNRIHEQSTFEFSNGTTGTVVDAWLETDNVASRASDSDTGNPTIDALPDMRGYGDARSLHDAMLADGALTSLVSSVVGLRLDQLGSVRATIDQIFYRWAGTLGVAVDSRGPNFDGRKLATMEVFLGTDFFVEGASNPNAQAAPVLTNAWSELVDGVLTRLLMAGPLGDIDPGYVYLFAADAHFLSTPIEDAFSAAATLAPTAGGTLAVGRYWAAVLPVLRELAQDQGIDTAATEYRSLLTATLTPFGLDAMPDLLDDGIQILVPPSSGLFTGDGAYHLSGSAETLYLSGQNQTVYAMAGDDKLLVTGSGLYFLDGGAGNDSLIGSYGADWLDGGTGTDTMQGGPGDDSYVVDVAADRLHESSGNGNDLVYASFSFVLPAAVEHLHLRGTAPLTGTGNDLNNWIVGNSAGNTLRGLNGNDTLEGGAGVDTMEGGNGADQYTVDASQDVVIDTAAPDADTVVASASFVLPAYLETLFLTGTALNGTGNGLNNQITGNDLANTLDGKGGSDHLTGGKGNDTYIVEGSWDSVYELGSEGTDIVRSSSSFTLAANIENLSLLGTSDADATGNELANNIRGNNGNNRLNGGGGLDTMTGLLGDDVYVVDDVADVVSEAVGGGHDRVEAALPTYTLSADVEDLALGSYWESVDRNGTGNLVGNRIDGTEGVNILKGVGGDDLLLGYGNGDRLEGGGGNDVLDGGTGNDTMLGATGNDQYTVDSNSDIVTENADAGTDRVLSWVSYVLGTNLEDLQLLGSAVQGVGNSVGNVLIGNSSGNLLDGKAGADSMEGGQGDDNYFVDHVGDVVVEQADQGGDQISTSVSLVLPTAVEHLVMLGSAALTATGNELGNNMSGNLGANVLRGLSGHDTLDGAGGNDTLEGGTGADLYVVDSTQDVVIDAVGGDADTVVASASFVLPEYVETLHLNGTAVTGTGNNLNNQITGNDLANTLDGKGGSDQLYGGKGNDTYIVEGTWDSVNESGDEGTDSVRSASSFNLPSNVEHLSLLGSSDANASGNELANNLRGNNGNNWLNGGAEADTLTGLLGDDGYTVDNAGDVVVEAVDGGHDRVDAALPNYTLTADVEDLSLGSYWESVDRNGTGNALGNRIDGTEGRNTLKGVGGDDLLLGYGNGDRLEGGGGNDVLDGGAGSDTMLGATGDDQYTVDSETDSVTENADAGADKVISWVNFILGSNVEDLQLVGSALNGTGNSAANILIGNSSNNVLDGMAGADSLEGAHGDDTYIVDNLADVVVERADQGSDQVSTSVSLVLPTAVEHLVMRGTAGLTATGNELGNQMTGNLAANVLRGLSGNDTLDGAGGNDTLEGGTGADWYVVDSTLDVVVDAVGGDADTVVASASFVLPTYVETLYLAGTAANGTGNNLNNQINGNDLANTLDGRGGSDQLAGGRGNDIYIVEGSWDSVNENADEGTDTVRAASSFSLSANIENLSLLGTSDANASGNELANNLQGNNGNNGLYGGSGADTMTGLLGDDVYAVDNVGDVVIEAVHGGHDRVEATLTSYTLTADVEDLSLGYYWESVDRNGTGNLVGNRIDGTEGVNILKGVGGDDLLLGYGNGDRLEGGGGNDVLDGGTGNDTMLGATGNDQYTVDSNSDIVTENADAGTDRVLSWVSYILGTNLEDLQLLGSAVQGVGNSVGNVLIGNSSGNLLDGKAGADSMEGGQGDDNYFVDHVGDVVVEQADQGGDQISTSVSLVLPTAVEHLVMRGSAGLTATGNELGNNMSGNLGANVLRGLSGHDTLDGAGGNDTLEGGTGADLYVVDSTQDVVIDAVGGDADTVVASASFVLPEYVETLHLNGTAVTGTGNNLNNQITGNDLANTLDGKGGSDQLSGGKGNDTYIVEGSGDSVHENFGEGTDVVQSTWSYSLGSHLEHLVLLGSGDADATGNELANDLRGNNGNNRLNGSTGDDTMTGLLGDDVYVVDSVSDVIVEAAGGGHDRVEAALASFTLAADIEDLALGSPWENVARNGTGNAVANRIDGTEGVNTLKGLGGDDRLFGFGNADRLEGGDGNDVLDGGSGNDAMIGGLGDDEFIVDSGADTVSEALDGGLHDKVISSVSFILGTYVEDLVLSGGAPIDGAGNASDNVIQGNGSNNVLDGRGGNDVLSGDQGDDTYVVDAVGDQVIETAFAGTDTVRSSVSWALASGVENLTLVGTAGLNGTGNELQNTLVGNSGANRLTGGHSTDVLTGGGGTDTFVWTHVAEFASDVVTDFLTGDKLDFSGIDADELVAGDQAFQYIGNAAFTTAHQIRSYGSGSDTIVEVNVDGSMSADGSVRLVGTVALTSASFLL